MKARINKVIALGICMIMLFSAGVFAEEGAELAVAPENKVSEIPIVQVEDNVSENKDAEPAKEVISEINPEKAEEKLTVEDTNELPEKEILIEEVQEEVIQAIQAPIFMSGPAGPLKALYPVRVSGTVGLNKQDESVICGERAGITGVYGKETVNHYDRNKKITVTVYREGYLGNMLSKIQSIWK